MATGLNWGNDEMLVDLYPGSNLSSFFQIQPINMYEFNNKNSLKKQWDT
jgi:hypothetical protein